MACEKPIQAYRAPDGGPILFNRPLKGQAGENYIRIDLPCGTCILCRQEYARQTAIRLTHEASQHEKNCFLTLTYDDKHLPPHGSLDYSHLQKFWKRVRINLSRKRGPEYRIRYYAVGEYGDKSLRAHYHACIFGEDFKGEGMIPLRGDSRLYTNVFLMNDWGYGNISIGELNFATARYTASYVVKKLRRKQKYVRLDEQTGELIPLVQPRAMMSRNLAKTWFLKFGHQLAHHDRVVINGQPQKPPRAYDKWLAAQNEEAAALIKQRRKERAKALTPEESRARARNAHARVERKSKSI